MLIRFPKKKMINEIYVRLDSGHRWELATSHLEDESKGVSVWCLKLCARCPGPMLPAHLDFLASYLRPLPLFPASS